MNEAEKYKKALEHCCNRLDLITRMINRYKQGLLESICVVDNRFTGQQSAYHAEIEALRELSDDFMSDHEERDALLLRLQKMNEIVAGANNERVQLLEENEALKNRK